ncbi:hypothetical protein PRIC1_011569 [Phytophthora ramorum]
MDIDGDVPAAAQLSQADIIERQAETIARLKRQVKKGSEYKQLTKTKLKEAAARLREYRLRVETLLQEGETLKKQVKANKQEVKPKKQVRNAATQTESKATVSRTSQTTLSGQVQRVIKKTQVDAGVQTVDAVVDTFTSRKRTREHVPSEMDQLVPKLSREIGRKDAATDTSTTSKLWTSQEPLQMLGAVDTVEATFPHATSAALDAELAFSDSDDGSGGTGDTLEIGSGQETLEVGESSGGGFDQSVLNEIDKELELSSSDEEEEGHAAGNREAGGERRVDVDGDAGKAVEKIRAEVSLLGELDSSMLNEIDKELETSSDEEDEGRTADSGADRRHTGGADLADKVGVGVAGSLRKQIGDDRDGSGATTEPPRLGGLDALSNIIDKELETSSDEEDGNQGATDAKKPRTNSKSTAGVESKRTLMSIDDELDGELAALSSSSSSSDSDSSDSSDSDSDSDDDGDDPMPDNADKNEVVVATEGAEMGGNKNLREANLSAVSAATSLTRTAPKPSIELEMKKGAAETTEQQTKDSGERRASHSSSTDKDAVVITTPVKKKPVTAVEDAYSPVVTPEFQPPTPEPLRLDASAAPATQSTDNEQSATGVGSQDNDAPEKFPDTSQVKKTGDKGVTSAPDTNAAVDAQPSPSDVSLPGMSPPKKLPSKGTSINTDQPTESDGDTANSTKQTSDLPLCDSVPSSAQPGELETPESDGVSGDTFPEKDSTIGRSRKADEAKLGDSTITAHKKVKLTEAPVQVEGGPGEKVAKARAATDSKTVKKKTAAKVETKEELRMKNSFTAFKQAIVLGQGEEADNEYARRTIALLVNQSSKFIDTHAAHVTTLCQSLAVAYRKLDVTPMMVVRGALGVFRTPRSRRLMAENKLGLSWLCNQVLLKLMSTAQGRKQDGSVAPGALCLSLVDECLQHLRGLLVEERHSIGDFLSVSRVQVQVAALQIKVSHDKVFLAHICALHTHLCQSTGQLARSRVLLFELLRDNPNIRGLYFAMGMLEIYPAILEREFDQHCVERQVVLKETLQQVLVAIACVAAERQELLLHQSSITMMHRIAGAVQMPELEEVDGGGPSFSRSCVEKLFEKLAASCQPEDQGKHVPVNYFEIAKSLEVCTAVYGLDAITEVLSIERCQELFSHANAEAKSGIIFVVGHIAMAVAPKTSDTQSPRTRSEQYVENVIEWLYHILSAETSDDKTSPDDRFKVLLGCSTVCVELIVEYSALAGLDSRRRVLCAVVKWFDATPSEVLIGLPATFLRRLRLAVVAARPQEIPKAG